MQNAVAQSSTARESVSVGESGRRRRRFRRNVKPGSRAAIHNSFSAVAAAALSICRN